MQVSISGQEPVMHLAHERACLPRLGPGGWEEFRGGQWQDSVRDQRCKSLLMWNLVKVTCRVRVAVRDAHGRTQFFGQQPRDFAMEDLPLSSVDLSWTLAKEEVLVWTTQRNLLAPFSWHNQLKGGPMEGASSSCSSGTGTQGLCFLFIK